MKFDKNYNVTRKWRGELDEEQPEQPDESQGDQQSEQPPDKSGRGTPGPEQLQARASAPPAGKKNAGIVSQKTLEDRKKDKAAYAEVWQSVDGKTRNQHPNERGSAMESYDAVDTFLDQAPREKASRESQLRDFEERTHPYNVHEQHRTIHGTLDTKGWNLLNTRSKHNKMQRSFIQVVEKLAEDLVGYPYVGDDEWDIERIMMRSITREDIHHCRQTRDREALVLVLDTSGSCSQQATMYSKFAEIAQGYSDIDIIIAPNAIPTMIKYGHKDEWERYNRRELVTASDEHKYGFVLDWPVKGRTIIFFGDLDGSDWVIRASWRNNIYWFNSENRTFYRNMERIRKVIRDAHSYEAVEYPLDMFRGKRIDNVTTMDGFMKAARRVRI